MFLRIDRFRTAGDDVIMERVLYVPSANRVIEQFDRVCLILREEKGWLPVRGKVKLAERDMMTEKRSILRPANERLGPASFVSTAP